MRKLLVTGGNGRLGRELLPLLKGEVMAPGRAELNIEDEFQIHDVVAKYRPDAVLHLAAYTDVPGAEKDREGCWNTNVVGTRNVAFSCRYYHCELYYISTDYVFDGKSGGYKETDPPSPLGYYALTKLIGEEAVRQLAGGSVIRTSFKPRPWPYPSAYKDQFSSADYSDVIAQELAFYINEGVLLDTIHIGTERKSMYDLARQSRPDVSVGLRTLFNGIIPEDVSLDCSTWNRLKAQIMEQE